MKTIFIALMMLLGLGEAEETTPQIRVDKKVQQSKPDKPGSKGENEDKSRDADVANASIFYKNDFFTIKNMPYDIS